MSIIGGAIGHASKTATVDNKILDIVIDGEIVEKSYKLIRDYFVFTNKRVIFVNKQGVTGKKTSYHSVPYRSISRFSVETSGHLDLDAELKIWVSGSDSPYQKRFGRSVNVAEIQAILAKHILG